MAETLSALRVGRFFQQDLTSCFYAISGAAPLLGFSISIARPKKSESENLASAPRWRAASVPKIRISGAPTVSLSVLLSVKLTDALSGRFPGVFGGGLLTGPSQRGGKVALSPPTLSGPVALADAVRIPGITAERRFQRDRHPGHPPMLLRLQPETRCMPCPNPQPERPPEGSGGSPACSGSRT